MFRKKKFILVIVTFFLLITALIYLINQYPSNEEKAYHRIAMCYVIEHQEIKADNKKELIQFFNQVAQGGVPDYALNKPKIYDSFANKLIDYYLKLSPEKQQEVKLSRGNCDRILQGL